MPRTGIVIVTHNSASHIQACLDAVGTVRAMQDLVVVIDNASSDESVALASSHGVNARVISNTRNAGFAGAANQGFEAVKNEVDAILLLNPDVVLKTPLDALSAACERNGIAGGRLNDATGNPQIGFAFRRFPTPLALFCETIGLNRLWKSNPVNRSYRCLAGDSSSPQTVDQPAGAMLMIRRDLWVNLNGLDEQFYPVWFEDVDFCRRAANAGFRAAYVPSVEGTHVGGHSVLQIPNRTRRRYWYASLLRYSRKHFGRAGWALVAGGVSVTAVIRSVGAMLRFREGSLKAARMDWSMVREAFAYPIIETAARNLKEELTADTANSRSHVSTEGNPSKENTERTLKRLHAR